MARALRRTVVSGGVSYPAGTTATAELSRIVTNPRAWEGEDGKRSVAVSLDANVDSFAANMESADASTAEVQEPPRGGAGSGETAWRAYAAHLGIEIPEDADRGDIIALVDARNSDD